MRSHDGTLWPATGTWGRDGPHGSALVPLSCGGLLCASPAQLGTDATLRGMLWGVPKLGARGNRCVLGRDSPGNNLHDFRGD